MPVRIEAGGNFDASIPRLGGPVRISIAVASAAFLLSACATSKGEPQPVEVKSTGVPGEAMATATEKVTATVKAIDAARRTLTLEGKDGATETIKVRPEVKRFGEIAVGDVIVAEVTQGLLLQYQAPGAAAVAPGAAVAGGVAGAGSPPGGAVVGGLQATVTVVDIATGSRIVTFQDPDGNKYKVKAGPGLQIDKLKVGDRLLATYVETLAVGLEKAGSKP
jgi:hypothetical protein